MLVLVKQTSMLLKCGLRNAESSSGLLPHITFVVQEASQMSVGCNHMDLLRIIFSENSQHLWGTGSKNAFLGRN